MTKPQAKMALDGGPIATFKSPGPILCHEGAHAVVMVRLGLPLQVVYIEDTKRDGLYHGFTVLDEETSHRWQDDPSALEARAGWEKMAAVYMAGVESNLKHGKPGWPHDLALAATCAAFLGLPGDGAFLRAASVVAAREMGRDGGAAWGAVSWALDKTLRLTGDEVRELVRLSDEARRTA